MANFFARIGRLTLVMVLLGAGIGILGYLLPKANGDRFADTLRVIDVPGIEATLCNDTTMGQVMGLVSAGGSQISALLAQLLNVQLPQGNLLENALIVESEYNVLTSRYTFKYRLLRDVDILVFRLNAGLETQPIEIFIRRNNPFAPCVAL